MDNHSLDIVRLVSVTICGVLFLLCTVGACMNWNKIVEVFLLIISFTTVAVSNYLLGRMDEAGV